MYSTNYLKRSERSMKTPTLSSRQKMKAILSYSATSWEINELPSQIFWSRKNSIILSTKSNTRLAIFKSWLKPTNKLKRSAQSSARTSWTILLTMRQTPAFHLYAVTTKRCKRRKDAKPSRKPSLRWKTWQLLTSCTVLWSTQSRQKRKRSTYVTARKASNAM